MNEYGKIEREHSRYGDTDARPLKVFEKTWGHRLLMGLSICMFVAALVLIIYCGMRLANLSGVGVDDTVLTFGMMLYSIGLVGGIAIVPPAVLGVVVASHPNLNIAAIVAAIIALVLVAAFVIYAVVLGGQVFSVVLYTVLLAILPIVYLIAAIKIRGSNK